MSWELERLTTWKERLIKEGRGWPFRERLRLIYLQGRKGVSCRSINDSKKGLNKMELILKEEKWSLEVSANSSEEQIVCQQLLMVLRFRDYERRNSQTLKLM